MRDGAGVGIGERREGVGAVKVVRRTQREKKSE